MATIIDGLTQCRDCGKMKELQEFDVIPIYLGRMAKCHICHLKTRNEYKKRYRKKNPEYAAKDRIRSKTRYYVKINRLDLGNSCTKCTRDREELTALRIRLVIHHPEPYAIKTAVHMCSECHPVGRCQSALNFDPPQACFLTHPQQ